MNVEEFLEAKERDGEDDEAIDSGNELDVQKVVVEELAADKAKLDLQIAELTKRIGKLEKDLAEARLLNEGLSAKNGELAGKLAGAESSIKNLESRMAELQELEFDRQQRNPNALALLDRDMDLPDRFPGETRDHVIEVIREARDMAEADGRIRRAQVLEGVLVANEPNGNLAQKRAELEKLFKDNCNIISGPVMEELEKRGIQYKNGEEYLLVTEIMKRTY